MVCCCCKRKSAAPARLNGEGWEAMTKSNDNSIDMILPVLREMRAENVRLHEDTRTRTDKRFNIVEARLNKIEGTMVSYRQALSSDTLLSRLVTGEFEERIEAFEKKVKHLEKQK
jgi:hypothetical protein